MKNNILTYLDDIIYFNEKLEEFSFIISELEDEMYKIWIIENINQDFIKIKNIDKIKTFIHNNLYRSNIDYLKNIIEKNEDLKNELVENLLLDENYKIKEDENNIINIYKYIIESKNIDKNIKDTSLSILESIILDKKILKHIQFKNKKDTYFLYELIDFDYKNIILEFEFDIKKEDEHSVYEFILSLTNNWIEDTLKKYIKNNNNIGIKVKQSMKIVIVIYDYFYDVLMWMLFSENYPLYTLQYIYKELKNNNIEDILKFEDMVIGIDLEYKEQRKLKKEIENILKKELS